MLAYDRKNWGIAYDVAALAKMWANTFATFIRNSTYESVYI
jgi:hypothetical protein